MNVLLAHEDPGEHYSFQQALEAELHRINLTSVYTGYQVLDYLNNTSEKNGALPALLIANLQLPFVDGIEVARKLRDDPSLSQIRVYLFSRNISPDTKRQALGNGVDGIHEIPANPNDFRKVLSGIITEVKSFRERAGASHA